MLHKFGKIVIFAIETKEKRTMPSDPITFGEIISSLYWIYMIAAVITSFNVVLNNRIPIKTITWVMVILAFPFIGIMIYLMFGRDNRRRQLISRRFLTQIQKKSLLMYSHSGENLKIPAQYSRLIQFFENIADAYPTEKSDIEIISDGKEFFDRLVYEIGEAKDHIHIQFYIFRDDEIGHRVREALMAKAAEGVEVRLIYDDVGCWNTKDEFFEEMRCAGMYVKAFMKIRSPFSPGRVNYRNHRKLVIIDGKKAFIGGMNVADRYIDGGKWESWRDIMLFARGEAVYGMQTSFLVDWYFVDRSLISGSRYYPPAETGDRILTQTVSSNPIGRWREMLQGMAYAISCSRDYLYIQTPYFMPSDYVLTAILNLALAGADVRIMVPEESDNMITQLASRSYLADVMSAGVKVYLYRKGFLHSKMLVSDDALCSIGSANIDFRSFECNFEINTFVYDNDIARRLKTIFMNDLRDCRQLTYKEIKEQRSLPQRLKESVARLFSPIL